MFSRQTTAWSVVTDTATTLQLLPALLDTSGLGWSPFPLPATLPPQSIQYLPDRAQYGRQWAEQLGKWGTQGQDNTHMVILEQVSTGGRSSGLYYSQSVGGR